MENENRSDLCKSFGIDRFAEVLDRFAEVLKRDDSFSSRQKAAIDRAVRAAKCIPLVPVIRGAIYRSMRGLCLMIVEPHGYCSLVCLAHAKGSMVLSPQIGEFVGPTGISQGAMGEYLTHHKYEYIGLIEAVVQEWL